MSEHRVPTSFESRSKYFKTLVNKSAMLMDRETADDLRIWGHFIVRLHDPDPNVKLTIENVLFEFRVVDRLTEAAKAKPSIGSSMSLIQRVEEHLFPPR
ncbi:MAG TPA: hypothetical protein VLG67_01220 [Candidatus Saccharimonadales bacterium]|nr:hypothetical protein [Candidatus Saccharimonadales bacterium]